MFQFKTERKTLLTPQDLREYPFHKLGDIVTVKLYRFEPIEEQQDKGKANG